MSLKNAFPSVHHFSLLFAALVVYTGFNCIRNCNAQPYTYNFLEGFFCICSLSLLTFDDIQHIYRIMISRRRLSAWFCIYIYIFIKFGLTQTPLPRGKKKDFSTWEDREYHHFLWMKRLYFQSLVFYMIQWYTALRCMASFYSRSQNTWMISSVISEPFPTHLHKVNKSFNVFTFLYQTYTNNEMPTSSWSWILLLQTAYRSRYTSPRPTLPIETKYLHLPNLDFVTYPFASLPPRPALLQQSLFCLPKITTSPHHLPANPTIITQHKSNPTKHTHT